MRSCPVTGESHRFRTNAEGHRACERCGVLACDLAKPRQPRQPEESWDKAEDLKGPSQGINTDLSPKGLQKHAKVIETKLKLNE